MVLGVGGIVEVEVVGGGGGESDPVGLHNGHGGLLVGLPVGHTKLAAGRGEGGGRATRHPPRRRWVPLRTKYIFIPRYKSLILAASARCA